MAAASSDEFSETSDLDGVVPLADRVAELLQDAGIDADDLRPAGGSDAESDSDEKPRQIRKDKQCKGEDCVFSCGNPGKPGHAASGSKLCMWCDPPALLRAQQNAQGRGRVNASLNLFARKSPAVHERALQLLPEGWKSQSRLCVDAACIFSRRHLGERAYTFGSPLCMWCDSDQLRAAQATARGQGNIAQSLQRFLARPDVAEAAWGKLSAEYQALPAKRRALRRERRKQLESDRESEERERLCMYEEDPLQAQRRAKRRELDDMGNEDALTLRYARECQALRREDYLAEPRPSHLHPSQPLVVIQDFLECEHVGLWHSFINSISRPGPPECRFCIQGYRYDDPPPLCRYHPGKKPGDVVTRPRTLRDYAFDAEKHCREDYMIDLLNDPDAQLSMAARLAKKRLLTWNAEMRRWREWQVWLGKESESEESGVFGRKELSKLRARAKREGWTREKATGDLFDGIDEPASGGHPAEPASKRTRLRSKVTPP